MDVPGLTADQRLRLECAAIAGPDVAAARALYDFITGAHDKTPMERITDALRNAGVK